MSVHRFLAWIRAKRRSVTQPQLSEGVIITTRLRELRDVTKCNSSETGPTQAQNNEGDQDKKKSEKFGT
jgi:hypothetical protein